MSDDEGVVLPRMCKVSAAEARWDQTETLAFRQRFERVRSHIEQCCATLLSVVTNTLAMEEGGIPTDLVDEQIGKVQTEMIRLCTMLCKLGYQQRAVDQMTAQRFAMPEYEFDPSASNAELVRKDLDRHVRKCADVWESVLASAFEQEVPESEVQSHPKMVELNKRLSQVLSRRSKKSKGKQEEQSTSNNGNDDDRESDDDDDMEIVGTQRSYVCPITKSLFVDPMKCTLCGHHYSKEAIFRYLRSADSRGVRCPVAGCKTQVSVTVLVDDPIMAQQTELHTRTQRRIDENNPAQICL
eukprot:ANDGO_00107.mRNA.1 E3 SUMO protein ligase NSE2